VSDDGKRRITFPFRFAASLRDRAKLLADRQGVSLNHCVSQAVAEKINRLSAKSHTKGKRTRWSVTREFAAYSIADLQERTIPAGQAVFAILTPATEDTGEIHFTLERTGDIWFSAPREVFLNSTRQ
jgi:hypothetical protein